MSTYTDKHCTLKENVAVDYHDRTTKQCIKLQNENNEYWGTFHGMTAPDAFIATPGLKLKHKGYDSISDLFDDGTGKSEDYVLKAHEVWRLVKGHEDQKTYEVDGLTINVGDIFVIKADIMIRDLTVDGLDFIHFGGGSGGKEYTAGNGLVLDGTEFSISSSVLADINDSVKTAKFNELSGKVESASIALSDDIIAEATRAKAIENELSTKFSSSTDAINSKLSSFTFDENNQIVSFKMKDSTIPGLDWNVSIEGGQLTITQHIDELNSDRTATANAIAGMLSVG